VRHGDEHVRHGGAGGVARVHSHGRLCLSS